MPVSSTTSTSAATVTPTIGTPAPVGTAAAPLDPPGTVAGAVGIAGAVAAGGSALTGIATGASVGAAAGGAAMLGGVVGGSMDAGAMSAEAIMAKANDVQNQLAMASAANQVAGLVRSMMMQVLRDFIKDAKDTVKDQGEAGHKP